MHRGISLLALGLLMASVACMPVAAAAESEDIQEIDALYATWREAVETGDIPQYVSVLHPEVRLLPPGAAAIVGADNYGRFLEPVFAAADYRIEVIEPHSIEVVGDVAVAEYTYVVHLDMKAEAEGINEPGALTDARTVARYFDVLKKVDGQWRVWRHFWQDPPPGTDRD
ncbi:MAG: nuclear transport factor 2 family protein [Gammaproteobacteria bacterium]|nr:nuclear transport factor 2 family protein [Gammaproteobacteria bacterium]